MEARQHPSEAARIVQLHAIARGFVTEGLIKRNFDAIPYTDDVVLKSPLTVDGPMDCVAGREALRTRWWASVLQVLGDLEVRDSFVNRELSAVIVEFRGTVLDPPCRLRIVGRFTVNAEGEIVEQENLYEILDAVKPGR